MNHRRTSFFIILICNVSLFGCAGQQTRTKSSVVDYLYPKAADVIIQPSIPTLKLPLKVGIAFVPDQSTRSHGRNAWTGRRGAGSALTAANKAELLDKVANNFRKLEFVSDIEVIPSEYLTPKGGFSNLEQIQTMYDIDVIALVSYDQAQFTDEGFLSLSYWTIVGAYIIAGEKNDTSTMLDTVVYDIKSRKMLFRAPGTSVVKGNATPVNLSEELRADSIQGFNIAADKMTENLSVQLELFKGKIKKSPEKVNIVHRKGYTGGGSTNLFELSLFFLIALGRMIFVSGSRHRGSKCQPR